MYASVLFGLAIAGGLLKLVFENFDRDTLLMVAVIACLAQFLSWPLAWQMGSRMTERIFRTWYDGHAGQPAPSIVTKPDPPPENPRAMIPLDVTESDAKEWLASLGL